ncbi:hypothetical protein P4641_08770 [Halalkalibacterium halodurans]|uniref:hypothetical protein n=1 Tax=Halalkalibacterium halodurans TaxID=86665 RepID=UPI002E200488|nr:hypothetical protein [Halalkalibacterium halodurans]
MNKEYETVTIQGKHGVIHLSAPKSLPTEDELDELHRTIAKVISKTKTCGQEKAANE